MGTGAVIGGTPVSLPAGVLLTPEQAWVTDYDTDSLIGIARD